MRIASLLLISIISLYASVVGNLSGKLSVDNGALNYNVPLNIPTGTAGLKPDISPYTITQTPQMDTLEQDGA